MSNINTIEDVLVIEDAVAEIDQPDATAVPTAAPRRGFLHRRFGERGLTTVEYAIGIVLIIALVGAFIVAISTGSFQLLVQSLFQGIFDYLRAQFKLPI